MRSLRSIVGSNLLLLVVAIAAEAAAQPAGLTIPPLPAPTGETTSADLAAGQQSASTALASLVAELERNNPELAAARRDVDMRVARIAPAGAPPDPTLSIGYMGGLVRPFFPSAATPNGFRQFSASQEIPYPGKLALRTRVALTEADAERWNYEDTRRRLVADLKTAYFDYAYVDRAIAVIRRNKELLEQFRQIAGSRFSVGKGIQQDVLKAQLEISLLLERLATFERQRGTLQAKINSLLYRPPDTPISADLTYEAVPLTQRLDELRNLVRQRDPAVKRDEQVVSRGQQALALAKKEVLPDFGVNFSSQKYVGGMPWMYGVDFMVKLPIFWRRKQRPMIAEAAAALESGKKTRDNTLAITVSQVTEEYLAATTSKQLAALYGDSVLPQARLALESSLAAYQVGSVDFLTMLTNFITVLNYEVSYEGQKAQYAQALARLEPLVGLELVK